MKHIRSIFILLAALAALSASALDIKLDGEQQPTAPVDTIYNPDIIYSPMPKTYEIAGVKVSGIKNAEDYVVIGYSGLSVGDKIEIPGQEITDAVRRFWRQGLYSKVQINVEKIAGDKAWLEIVLNQQPRMSEMRFNGVKGGEKKDIEQRLGMVSGQQLTPNIIAQVKRLVEEYYAKKASRMPRCA